MIRIGSRGSALARWQAEHIAAMLRQHGHDVSIEILVTTGDRIQHAPFFEVGTKGMFTKEIEVALTENRIDLAVHSLKDLPTELSQSYMIACIPERADARDAFVSDRYESLAALPPASVVGTSSLRRQAQLRGLRPDLELRELRGNVDTRLRKLEQGQYAAIVLAAAGLDRLGQSQWVRTRFSSQEMCPAAGQGALAIECRAEDRTTQTIVAPLDHAATRFAVTAERTALGRLEGGCHVPIGVHCTPSPTGFSIRALVAHPKGSTILREELHFEGEADGLAQAVELGHAIADRLIDRGARDLLSAPASLATPQQASLEKTRA